MKPALKTHVHLKDLILSLSLSAGMFALLAGAVFLLPGAEGLFDSWHPSLVFILTYLLQFVIWFFPFWFFVVDKYSSSWKDLGFRKLPALKTIAEAFVTYIAYIFVAGILALIIQESGLQIPGYEAQESYVPFFGTDALGVVTALTFVVFIGPFLEEIFFRGFIFRVFLKNWPHWIASILSAAVFSLAHLQLQTFVPLFLIGLVLNYSYYRTGSIWSSFAFHSLNNLIAFGLMFYLHSNPELLELLEEFAFQVYNIATL